MNRRDFLKTSLAITMLVSLVGYAQTPMNSLGVGDTILRLNPYIQPEERVEKRIYDNSQPKVVVWNEFKKVYDADDPLGYGLPRDENGNRYIKGVNGFVEGVSTPEKILFIPGLLAINPRRNRDSIYTLRVP